MVTTYDTLRIELNKCPPDCTLCEEACAKEKGANLLDLSRIKTVHVPEVSFHSAMVCVQCSNPVCAHVCPVGAISRDPVDGVVRIDESRCVGCGLCTVACPYGGIHFDSQKQKSFKCDRCGGSPKCVEACPYQAITYVKNGSVLGYLDDDDVVSPGTSACRGCTAELALRFTLRVLGKNTILFTAPGCLISYIIGFGTNTGIRLAHCPTLLTNTASTMTGVARYYKKLGRDVTLVGLFGDGSTVDIGFQPLSAAAERGENFIYICYDNEGYMNTGVQRSGSTPYGASTTTTPVGPVRHGKAQNSKYLPLLMLFHGAPYVATANVAYPEDFAKKLLKAKSTKDGMAYIHLYSPCSTGWRFPEDRSLDVCRLAVETRYFPLWEADHGEVRITEVVQNPRPVSDYVRPIGKYAHLTDEDIDQVQRLVDRRYSLIERLASMGAPCTI